MNKTTKIWLNYAAGIAFSIFLLWSIYGQISKQLCEFQLDTWLDASHTGFLILCILMMPVNLGIETFKWRLMASSAQPISYFDALKSVLGGIAFSIITPNRIGEYPGRILFLKRKNTIRLISVSILAAFSQFITLFFFGILGLIYYNFNFPGVWQKLLLLAAVILLIIITVVFFRFEQWSKYLERIKWLNRFKAYKYLLRKFTQREQLVVLALSAIRFIIFTAQYLVLLRWMNIHLSITGGFFTAFLFFWCIAVIPSIALAELGIRGKISLFLFQPFTQNTIGILAATLGLWCINLVIPAIIGSIILIRMRLLR